MAAGKSHAQRSGAHRWTGVYLLLLLAASESAAELPRDAAGPATARFVLAAGANDGEGRAHCCVMRSPMQPTLPMLWCRWVVWSRTIASF
jgi:hypothetical protein